MNNMKNRLIKLIKHIQESENCECEFCASQENGTYLDGLFTALSILNNKLK